MTTVARQYVKQGPLRSSLYGGDTHQSILGLRPAYILLKLQQESRIGEINRFRARYLKDIPGNICSSRGTRRKYARPPNASPGSSRASNSNGASIIGREFR